MNAAYFDFENQFYTGILNSFDASCGRLLRADRSQAIVWLLVDHVLLLFQSPVYVNVWTRCGDVFEARFSSISAQDRHFLGIKELSDEIIDGQQQDQIIINSDEGDLTISVRSLPNEKGLQPRPLNSKQAYGTIKKMLSCRKAQILEALKTYDETEYEAAAVVEEDPGTLDKAIQSAQKYFAPLRKRIGAVLDSVGKTELTETQSGKGLNLFAVIRWPSRPRIITPPDGRWDVPRSVSEYNYTAALCLSSRQENFFDRGKRQALQLQAPLPPSARSIADTPLTRGCVDFSLPNERKQPEWSRQYYIGHESLVGIHRESGENALYETVFKQKHADENIFYVPLHIGGIPWIALFTFNQGDRSPESMMRNYQIYRDLIPVLSESLSAATQAAFAESLSEIATITFEKHFGAPTFLESTNTIWNIISHLFPYPRPRLTAEGDQGEEIKLPGFEHRLFLVFSERGSRLPYRLLEKQSLRHTVEQQLQKAALRIQSLYKEALFVFGHQAGKLFQESGLPGFAPGKDRHLQGMKNRLYHAWGMAEAISALKHLGRGLPDEWFPRSLLTGSRWTEDVTGRVLDICFFFLSGALTNMPETWVIDIRTPEKADLQKIGQIKARFGDPLSVLPPLAEDQAGIAGTLALTVGLAELIRNARNHFQSNKNLIARSILDKRLDGRVMSLRLDSDLVHGQCSVTFKNVHVRETTLDSQTVRNLQQFEKSTLLNWGNVVVETTITGAVEEIDDQFDWVESKWVYRYSILSTPR